LPFTITLQNQSSQSDSYLWDFGNGDTSSVIFEPTLTYPTAGNYTIYLYVQDSICLLTDTAQITITVLDSLQLQVTDTIQLCAPVPWTFTANSNGTANQFIWSTNANFSDTLNPILTDSVVSIIPPGTCTYYVKAGNAYCSKVDSVFIQFVSSDIKLTGVDSLCIGENSTITAINSNPNSAFTFSWTPDSIIVSPTSGSEITVQPFTSQYVYVSAVANNGCVVNDSLFIAVGSLLPNQVSASASDYLVPIGGTTTLFGKPSGMQYTWTPPNGLTSPEAQNTVAKVDENTVYTLTVSDGICNHSDTVLIKAVAFICGEPFVFVPNAFTPNGDAENDILFVRGKIVEGLLFRIYDRWGELVFETTDRNKGWDGTYKGKQLDPDVFDYYLKATCIDGTESIIKGNVSLMK